ncbi:MAG: formate dehydrogenase major subunit [Chloroflexia bacterium]|jgi:formate dehydrogenase major subunit|nr:formate dehydrogenase major subunit [Chloroflexia bacterium]
MRNKEPSKRRNLFWRLGNSPQPYSAMSIARHSRIRDAVSVNGVCPYCAVGCAQRIYVKAGQVVDIEGDERSPINEGTLCPKGSNTFQLTVNPHRQQQALYRAPYSDKWETVPLDWAMQRIAQRVVETREATFVERDADGNLLNHTLGMAHLGGATLDNEENYLIKKLFSNLGIVAIENQARI